MSYRQPPTTIAILGADTVVGRALCVLLEGHGYRIAPVDSHPMGGVYELLGDADLLLLPPRLDGGVREAFVSAVGKADPQRADLPVIVLCTALEDGQPEKAGVICVPWPCETKALVESIEAALVGEGSENALAV